MYLLQGLQIENLKLRLNFSRTYGLLQMFVVKVGQLLNKIKEFNLDIGNPVLSLKIP